MENLDIGLIIMNVFFVILFLIFNFWMFFYSKLMSEYSELSCQEYYFKRFNFTILGYSIRLIYYFPTYLIVILFKLIKKLFVNELFFKEIKKNNKRKYLR